MSKYVIDTTLDNVKKVIAMGVTKGGAIWTDTTDIENLEELNSDYINEHFGDLQDTAYQRGLNDAWECARKVALNSNDGGLSFEKLDEIFDRYTLQQVLKDYTAKQTIEKLKAYEEKQKHDDKIEVGDTVNLKDGSRDNDGIVTKSWDNDRHFIMWADGSGGVWDKEYIVKTGRHFDIASILEDMRND